MSDLCHEPHPDNPDLLCEKTVPCLGYHVCGDEIWGIHDPVETQTRAGKQARLDDAATKTAPAVKTGEPKIIIKEAAPVGSLARAREKVMADRWEGTLCPCCDQRAQVYRRTINSGMARSLVEMYRQAKTEWVHIPSVLDAHSREESKLRYWDLVEESEEVRDDGGRAGWWRVTEKGERFILGTITVPQYAAIYNAVCLEVDGPPITIHDALGKKFRLDDLLAGR